MTVVGALARVGVTSVVTGVKVSAVDPVPLLLTSVIDNHFGFVLLAVLVVVRIQELQLLVVVDGEDLAVVILVVVTEVLFHLN